MVEMLVNTSQAVLTPASFGWVTLGQNSQSQALIFIETNGDDDLERYTFPGFIGLPPVSFPMPSFAREQGIEIDLEIDLYMQLEGDLSELEFQAEEGGGTDTLQTFQWDLQPG